MSVPEQTQSSLEVTGDSIIDSISEANTATPPNSLSTRIPKMVRQKDYEKYYVPKLVSIGPYHFGNWKLQYAETLKPVFAMKLVKGNKENLRKLYNKLGEPEMLKDLRSYYEETKFSDMEFTKMMLLDSCFILHCVRCFFQDCQELNRNQLLSVYKDLLLLENQIPFKVLREVMKFMEIDYSGYIKAFINSSSIVIPRRQKRKWLQNFKIIRSLLCIKNERSSNGGDEDEEDADHLLAAVHGKLTKIVKDPTSNVDPFKYDGWNFRKVSELVDLGISFKAMKDTTSLTHIEFVRGWWGFSGNVKLPPITVNDSTKHMLLNMIAYETCCFSIDDAWVTSYVCLLDSLIDDAEDVKVLRKAWVLENFLSSDKEVANLFNEITTDLVPNGFAYLEAKNKIQTHYGSWSTSLFSQLKNEYFKSPWAIFALLGALIALFLTGVQAYFTVWSPKSKCDDLCMFLKMNHHL